MAESEEELKSLLRQMRKPGVALGLEAGTLQVTRPVYALICPLHLFKRLLSSQLCGGKQQLFLCLTVPGGSLAQPQ